MNENDQYLFVYGTLLDDSNPYCAFLKENSRFYQEGRFRGALYNIGNYPGATIHPACQTFVYGSIFTMDDPKSVLKELDEYEGFGDDFSQPNEFVRELVTIETENGPMPCWAYLYNLPTEGRPLIPPGKY